MAIPKVMGIETEYGITVKNQPDFNPILSSLLLINSYETFRSSRVRWDYEAESPLRDARGFEYMEEKEGTSKEESRLINLILSNGARFYVDHAHPEYSGAENNADPCDYQISQRADFLETEVGLETMHSRPIINTRDEPHADPEKYRRLHVIVGDANMSEVSNYLKVGTMAIVLSMVEDDFIERQLIENYMAKHDLEWNDSRVQMIDLQFHDIRPGKGLFYKLEESDAVDRIATDDEIAKAIYDPPKDTRAYFRGMCLQRYADEIVSASWDSVIFDLKEGPLKKIFMLEPLRGTEAHVRQLLTESPTAADLLRNISRSSGGM